MEITLEYLTADNLDAVRAIHREDISERFADVLEGEMCQAAERNF